MKDILGEYYQKQYGRNKINNMSLGLNATKVVTFNLFQKRQKSTQDNIMKLYRPFHPNTDVGNNNKDSEPSDRKLPSLYSYMKNIQMKHSKKVIKSLSNIEIRKAKKQFSKSDRASIKEKANWRIEELLNENKNEVEEEESNLKIQKSIQLSKDNNISLKQPEVDPLVFIKEKLKSDLLNYNNVFKSDSIQISRTNTFIYFYRCVRKRKV